MSTYRQDGRNPSRGSRFQQAQKAIKQAGRAQPRSSTVVSLAPEL
jgi:hypothetical protein